jgi:hypothetical protein
MKKDPRKVVAAALGVIRYLEAEKRTRAEEAAEQPSATAAGGQAQGAASLWPASGNLFAMQVANLMRYRMYRGI